MPLTRQVSLTRSSIRTSERRTPGFTLVELLIVMSIFLLVSAIALPTVRTLISDQKVSQASRTIVAYLDEARSRAISEGRFVGVRIERASGAATVDFRTAAGVRLRQLRGVPPYTGEAADARVTFNYPTPGASTAGLEFSGVKNQLLLLYTDPTASLYGDDLNAPIKDGDLIELPGGRYFRLDLGDYTGSFASGGTDIVPATIDLDSPVSGITASFSNAFPVIHQPIDGASVPYRIHRSPVVSTSQSLTFPRGIVVDMTYSGIGIEGNQFAAQGTLANQPLEIVFGPDGRVEMTSIDAVGNQGLPTGLIFLCIGDSDGLQPATPFNADPRTPANLMNQDSLWIVINPATGRCVVAPNASVSSTASMPAALRDARSLAILSDTLDATP
ncbi:prepilin-type N-terminal cleavage/methylation domain-containing protein [Rhodopirellula islandica]|nr:prepilin-type N-terminal cleavage/methylation domain-containing protein [Rhodopirellula islandica]